MNSTPESHDAPEVDASDAVGEPEVEDASAEPVAPTEPDPALLEAHELARAALGEITSASSIGDPAGYRDEGNGVISLRFENRLGGYPGWFWTVSVARMPDAEPTVLEVELLPGDGALLAPEWVPWAVRLAEYQAAQAAAAEAAAAAGADVDDSDEADPDDLDDDLDDLDAADFDEDGSPILHAGDVDGVDIDELDPASADADDDDDDSDDDDSDDDGSDDDDSDDDSDDDDDFDDDSDEDDDEDDGFDDDDESDDEDESDDSDADH